jgi:hypothetical protein
MGPTLTPVLDLAVDCDAPMDVGKIATGTRRIVPITGGTFAGIGEVDLRGTIVPGGADWNLQRSDGVFEVYARYTLETDDGFLIGIINQGLVALDDGFTFRTVATFEVTEERHRWLTSRLFLGTVAPRNPFTGVDVRLYRVD